MSDTNASRIMAEPARGFTCGDCGTRGLAPSDFVGTICIDCAAGADADALELLEDVR